MDFYAPTARVISTEIMISLVICNKMINLYFQFVLKKQFKTRKKLKHTNITKFKSKEIKIKPKQINDKKKKKNVKFSTYHVNICTDMGYISMMTKIPICKTN